MNRHNQIYVALLIALGFFLAVGVVSILCVAQSPTVPAESRWTFRMSAAVNGMFLMAIVATLILRGTAPAAGRIATKALNIILLIIIPFGTALGIYGLLRVDKASEGPQHGPPLDRTGPAV